MAHIVQKETSTMFGRMNKSCDNYHYSMPSFEMLSNHEWIVCARQVRSLTDPKGRIIVKKSADEGVTWQDIPSPTRYDEYKHPQNGYLICHIMEVSPNELISVYVMISTDERKPLFSPVTDGMQPATVRITRSHDNGTTWENPKNIAFTTKDLLIPGKPVKLPDHAIGIPCETHDIWEQGYHEPLSTKFIRSSNHETLFSEGYDIVSHPYLLFGDARLMFFQDRLWAYFWTYNIKERRDEAVHRSFSCDGGRTWALPEAVSLKTQITSVANIKETTILAVTQDRFSKTPGIKALLSSDGGGRFDESSLCMIYKASSIPSGKNPFAQFDQFKFGYSTITPLSQNRFAVCYWHDHQGVCSVSVTVIEVVTES